QPVQETMTAAARFSEHLLRWLARRSPASRARLGRLLGAISWHAVRPRRRIALRNIELCFPHLTRAEQKNMARRHFMALAQSIVDRSVLWFGTQAQIRELVTLEGFEHVGQALQKGPVILLAPHFI